MAAFLPVPRIQWTDGNGFPLQGGSVAFCTPGTSGTVFRSVWADEGETIPLQNPVPLDSAGIAFSGGSQASLWGFGQYEVFVRDNSGNLIYSAIIDTAGGLEGGTINGSVQINGNLSVTGSITDTQSLTSPQINGTNANFGGTVSANILSGNTVDSSGDFNGNGNLNLGGNAGIGGSVQVNGNENVSGTVTAGALNTGGISAGSANIAGTLTAGTIDASSINAPGLLKAQGGGIGVPTQGTTNITFGFAFNSIISVVACIEGMPDEAVTIGVENFSNSGCTLTAWAPQAGITVGVFWIALGT